MKKKSTKIYLRTLKITTILLFCLSLLAFGCFKAYEGIRQVGFGEYKNAVEIDENGLRIMDMELFKKS